MSLERQLRRRNRSGIEVRLPISESFSTVDRVLSVGRLVHRGISTLATMAGMNPEPILPGSNGN